jgi:hypothetical protein
MIEVVEPVVPVTSMVLVAEAATPASTPPERAGKVITVAPALGVVVSTVIEPVAVAASAMGANGRKRKLVSTVSVVSNFFIRFFLTCKSVVVLCMTPMGVLEVDV